MNIVALSGSIAGSKTRTAIEAVSEIITKTYPEEVFTLIDLADYDLMFSDGRNYLEYPGDTGFVTQKLMEADIIIMGTPIFHASIPGALKNIFDLLPVNALQDKVVGILVTAGSAKHYLVVEQQLKPILSYMKASIVPTYVFMEEKDFYRKEIVNDDIFFRLERLIEDTFQTSEAMEIVKKAKEDAYGF
ncbi:NADPH-dependent FMN reductase [Gracilibacillus alcaliphilus]|uniref:NADPH-dependent FMN reductase n=1 Tax=Gracilibacillus alcaliphilus TaxID=1401441 RepID=UPI00195C011B|nr:NADPH-dependent FMN reductase [Gracilibacillus alcaliphilus]MBM7679342.1 FMN reductase [Gracilibacillus alcaliphilus]